MRDGLTAKQAAFVREYLIDLNGTRAAIRAGYSARTANEQAAKDLLTNPSVVAAIRDAQAKREKKLDISAERVLIELARIAFFDPRKLHDDDGSVKTVDKWDDDTAAVIAGLDVAEIFDGQGGQKTAIGLSKKVKLADKLKALELIGKHIAMFTDRTEISGNVTLVLDKLDAEA